MADNYSKLEMALMELDRAVTGLSRQAEGVRKTMAGQGARSAVAPTASRAGAKSAGPDLFSALGTLGTEGDGLDAIERRLDATIAQIEDLLNDDYAVA